MTKPQEFQKKAKIQHGGPRRATEERRGFRVQGSGFRKRAFSCRQAPGGKLRVAGAERSEAPVFWASAQPWRRSPAADSLTVTREEGEDSTRRATEGHRERRLSAIGYRLSAGVEREGKAAGPSRQDAGNPEGRSPEDLSCAATDAEQLTKEA